MGSGCGRCGSGCCPVGLYRSGALSSSVFASELALSHHGQSVPYASVAADAAMEAVCPGRTNGRRTPCRGGKLVIDRRTGPGLRQAVQGLPARYREPVVLRYLYGMETPEMLEILNIGRNALNVRLSRGREMLRERLADWVADGLDKSGSQMMDERLTRLFEDADRTAGRPQVSDAAVLVGLVRQRYHRRRIRRTAVGLCAAAVFAVVGTMVTTIEVQQRRIDRMQRQIADLTERTDATVEFVQRILNEHEGQQRLARSNQRLAAIPDPMGEIQARVIRRPSRCCTRRTCCTSN